MRVVCVWCWLVWGNFVRSLARSHSVSTCLLCMGIPRLANRIKTSRHEICLDVSQTMTICPSSCLSSVIFWFYCYVHCLYSQSTEAQQQILRHPFVSILSCGQTYTDIQRLSEFAFFSRNKSDKKDNLSHESLNIMPSSNAIVKILFHAIYFSSHRFVKTQDRANICET